MAGGAPTAPEQLTGVKDKSEEVKGQLGGFYWSTAMTVAGDHRPIQYADQIIQQATRFIHDWIIGPELVNEVALQWVSIANDFQKVTGDCQAQLGVIKDHWAGLAAETFSQHSTQLLARLDKGSPATGGVATNLSNQSAALAKIRSDIMVNGATTAIDALNGALQIANTIVNTIDANKLILAATGVGVPLVVVQACMQIVAQMSNQLSTVLKDLLNMANNVNKGLADIKNSALQMKNSVDSQLYVPPVPPGMGDPGKWDPKV